MFVVQYVESHVANIKWIFLYFFHYQATWSLHICGNLLISGRASTISLPKKGDLIILY